MEKKRAEFTRRKKKTHTIYMPQMLYYHNDLLKAAFAYGGYQLDIVPECKVFSKHAFSTVNKDYCTCATYIVGNLLTFLDSGQCDPKKVAFLEPQAGGACRAGNYYNLIIKCLQKAGYPYIPVISLNFDGSEKHSGFSITSQMLFAAVAAVLYSDFLMVLTQQIRPYEIHKGETEALRQNWLLRLSKDIQNGHHILKKREVYEQIIADFQKIKVDKSNPKKKVGITGELYIKYSPVGNNHLEDFLQELDCEYHIGTFTNYCIYVVYTSMQSMLLENGKPLYIKGHQKVIDYLCKLQKEFNEVLERAGLFYDAPFYDLKQCGEEIINEFYNIGDGWLIAAETVDLIKHGFDHVLLVHPFGCLVSHVGERGILKKIHDMYPNASVQSIEYDIDQSKTLRESRIMLALETV